MDAEDVRIFCEMAFEESPFSEFTGRHVSPSGIGRKLGLDEKTVRARVRRMEEEGFIKYYQAIPNLALFGLRNLSLYRLESVNLATKRRLVEHIQTVPYVVDASDYLGRAITVDLAGDSMEEVQKTVDELVQRYELNSMNIGNRFLSEPAHIPDHLDWQIIKGLRFDARRASRDIARELSITPRMTEYRIVKLLGSRTMDIRAVINTQKQQGLLFYELEMVLAEEKQRAILGILKEMHGEKLWSIKRSTGGVLIVGLFSFTLGEPEEAAANAIELDGVRRCSLFILKEIVEPQKRGWIDRAIEENLAAARSR